MSWDEKLAPFLERVCRHIYWKKYQARVRAELTDHIITHAEYLMNFRGYTENEAITQAIYSMGNPDELGKALCKAYHPVSQFFCAFALVALCAGIAFLIVYMLLYIFS